MDKQEKLRELAERVERLPEEARKACYWVIENYDAAAEMCREPIPPETWETLWRESVEKEEYHMMALLLLERTLHDDAE